MTQDIRQSTVPVDALDQRLTARIDALDQKLLLQVEGVDYAKLGWASASRKAGKGYGRTAPETIGDPLP